MAGLLHHRRGRLRHHGLPRRVTTIAYGPENCRCQPGLGHRRGRTLPVGRARRLAAGPQGGRVRARQLRLGRGVHRAQPGLGPTLDDCCHPARPGRLCIVAQGRKAVTVGGETYLYDPFRYLVLSSHLHFQAEILEAVLWPPRSCPWCCRSTRRWSGRCPATCWNGARPHSGRAERRGPASPRPCVSALDQELTRGGPAVPAGRQDHRRPEGSHPALPAGTGLQGAAARAVRAAARPRRGPSPPATRCRRCSSTCGRTCTSR